MTGIHYVRYIYAIIYSGPYILSHTGYIGLQTKCEL